jgi:hypothetical protein
MQQTRPLPAWIAHLDHSATCMDPQSACCVLQDSTHQLPSRRRAWIARWVRTAPRMAAAGAYHARLASQHQALALTHHRAATSR